MAVAIKIQFNGKSLTIPINPEELSLSRSADNEDIDIIGIGPVTRKGHPGLYKLSIDSFFPGEKSYFYTGVKPTTCVDFIDTIWKTENNNNNVAKIVTTGLIKNLNMYFIIEDFEWDYKAGEEDDIYYNLKIKEYVPYGVKTVPWKIVEESKRAALASARSRASSTNVSNSNSYKVQKGDCLWNIAKAASGSGSNWKQLYNLNKKVIGSNPNLIRPGQILTLPDGWKGNITVQKLTGSSKSSSKKTTSTTKSKVSSNTKTTTSAKRAAANYKAGGGGYSSAGGGTGAKGGGTSTKYVLQPKQSALSKLVASKKTSLPTYTSALSKSSGGGGIR